MKAVLQNPRTGLPVVDEVPPPALRPGGILVRVERSVIGLGTERTVMALAQEPASESERPAALLRRMLRGPREESGPGRYKSVRNVRPAPIPLGYSCSGRVLEVGSEAEEFRVGDRVACYGLHFASHAEVNYVPRNLAVRVPDGLSSDAAAFVALGAIAMQGVRLAQLGLGDRVVVLGLGLTGQLAAQLARCTGATVLASDPDPEKCRLARSLGAHATASGLGELKQRIASFTEGHGADAVLVCAASSTSELLRAAAESSRLKGRVVIVGDVGLGVERRPAFDKEVELVVSRSFGPGRFDAEYELHGRDYPLPFVRWTERRNGAAFLELLSRGDVDALALVGRHAPIERADEAYRAVTGGEAGPALSIVLDYRAPTADELHGATVRLPGRPTELARPSEVHLGAIGAGQFAKGVLLPAFAAEGGVRMRAFCTSSGLTSKAVAERYGASFCTSNPDEVVESEEVNAVLVTTRHDRHAPLALAALRAGKAVFVEKPLCIRPEELVDFARFGRANEPRLMVGYSRRFSPLARRCRELFDGCADPLSVTCRVNAPELPEESWIHDPELGGGRILSDVCQFVDLVCFLTGSLPRSVRAEAIPVPGSAHPNRDSVCVTLRMQNDALGVVHYLTNGDASVPRERVEVNGGGRTAILDDYRALALHEGGRRRVKKLAHQQKGFREEVAAFVAAIRGGGEMPIPFDQLLAVSRTAFLIRESLERDKVLEWTPPALRPPIL